MVKIRDKAYRMEMTGDYQWYQRGEREGPTMMEILCARYLAQV